MKTLTIGDLTFQRLDDAAAMRLLRAFFRIGKHPDNAALHAEFWRDLAALCLTPPDRTLVLATRTALSKDDPVCTWSIAAHWLGIRFGADAPALSRTVELLTGLPGGTLGG